MLARRHLFPLLIALGLVPRAAAQCSYQTVVGTGAAELEEFGSAVAIDGDTALIGARSDTFTTTDQGGAYVFERGPNGWTQTAVLLPSTPSQFANFGTSVALEGNRALVAAFSTSDPTIVGGAVYVFERSPAGWSETAVLSAADGQWSDGFGVSVALSGDFVLVGSQQDDDGPLNSGSAYLFEDTASGWTLVTKLTASDAESFALFGSSVALSTGWALIGAANDMNAGVTTGAAYFFQRTPSGWVEAAKLVPSDGSPSGNYGRTVAIDDDLAVIGASRDLSGTSTVGAAYVFERTFTGWSEVQKLRASDAVDGHRFGRAVAIDDETVLVGNYSANSLERNAGAGYVFEKEGDEWTEVARLVPPTATSLGELGFAVALEGTTALLGGPALLLCCPDSSQAVFAERGPNGWPAPVDLVQAYCFCDADSPCGNEDATAGCASSTGSGALLAACGAERVSVDNLVLEVTGLPPNQFGLVYMGPATIDVPFGDGARCVGGASVGTFRFPPQSSGASGSFAEGPGIAAFSQSFGNGAITAGSSWAFQAWYRDPGGPCGAGFNLSNGVQVGFAP